MYRLYINENNNNGNIIKRDMKLNSIFDAHGGIWAAPIQLQDKTYRLSK